jgi:hypothetical protein
MNRAVKHTFICMLGAQAVLTEKYCSPSVDLQTDRVVLPTECVLVFHLLVHFCRFMGKLDKET